jgi:hypothetical protein
MIIITWLPAGFLIIECIENDSSAAHPKEKERLEAGCQQVER